MDSLSRMPAHSLMVILVRLDREEPDSADNQMNYPGPAFQETVCSAHPEFLRHYLISFPGTGSQVSGQTVYEPGSCFSREEISWKLRLNG